jgi:hypothetical protein
MLHFIFSGMSEYRPGQWPLFKRFVEFSPRQPGVVARNRHLHTDSRNDSTGHLRRQSNRGPACVLAQLTTLASVAFYLGFEVSRHFDSGSVLDTQAQVTFSFVQP